MRKLLITFVAAMLLGGASALELPFQGNFVLMADGVVVGTGELDESGLEVRLADGTLGFDGVLVVLGDDGVMVEYQVSVGADGSVMLWDSLTDLNRAVIDAGGEVRVSFDLEDKDVANANEDLLEAAEDAAEALEDAAERAAEEAEEALEREAEQAERDAEEAAEAAEEAAERAAEDGGESDEDDEDDTDTDDASDDEDDEDDDEDDESDDD